MMSEKVSNFLHQMVLKRGTLETISVVFYVERRGRANRSRPLARNPKIFLLHVAANLRVSMLKRDTAPRAAGRSATLLYGAGLRPRHRARPAAGLVLPVTISWRGSA